MSKLLAQSYPRIDAGHAQMMGLRYASKTAKKIDYPAARVKSCGDSRTSVKNEEKGSYFLQCSLKISYLRHFSCKAEPTPMMAKVKLKEANDALHHRLAPRN